MIKFHAGARPLARTIQACLSEGIGGSLQRHITTDKVRSSTMTRISRLSQAREVWSEIQRVGGIILFGYGRQFGRSSRSYWASEKSVLTSILTKKLDCFYLVGRKTKWEHRKAVEEAAELSGLPVEGDTLDLLFFVVTDAWRWFRQAMKEALCTHPRADHYQIEEDPHEYPGMMQDYCGKCGGAIYQSMLDRHTVK